MQRSTLVGPFLSVAVTFSTAVFLHRTTFWRWPCTRAASRARARSCTGRRCLGWWTRSSTCGGRRTRGFRPRSATSKETPRSPERRWGRALLHAVMHGVAEAFGSLIYEPFHSPRAGPSARRRRRVPEAAQTHSVLPGGGFGAGERLPEAGARGAQGPPRGKIIFI